MERIPGNNQGGDVLPLNTTPVDGAELRPVDKRVVEPVQVQRRRPRPLYEGNRLTQNPM